MAVAVTGSLWWADQHYTLTATLRWWNPPIFNTSCSTLAQFVSPHKFDFYLPTICWWPIEKANNSIMLYIDAPARSSDPVPIYECTQIQGQQPILRVQVSELTFTIEPTCCLLHTFPAACVQNPYSVPQLTHDWCRLIVTQPGSVTGSMSPCISYYDPIPSAPHPLRLHRSMVSAN